MIWEHVFSTTSELASRYDGICELSLAFSAMTGRISVDDPDEINITQAQVSIIFVLLVKAPYSWSC